MGEAKRRSSAPQSAEFERLRQRFAQLGVRADAPGFYDSPAFVAAERRDPELLNAYAEWVFRRPRDPTYEDRVREVVPSLASLFGDWLDAEGLHGACVNASNAMTRMLDRLGIWSFVAKGAASVGDLQRPQLGVRSWHAVDDVDHEGGFVGHAWVCAPPFLVVDVALKRQHWEHGSFGDLLPSAILVERATRVKSTPEDVIAAQLIEQAVAREGCLDPNLHHRQLPHLRGFNATFGAWEADLGQARLRYIPTGVIVSDEPLEHLTKSVQMKVSPIQFWTDVVRPRFSNEDPGA